MALEDFETYTEVDDQVVVTVATNTISWVALSNDDGTDPVYVYSDKGASHFGNFEHLFSFDTSNPSANTVYAVPWAVGSAVGQWAGMNDSLLLYDARQISSSKLYLREFEGGVAGDYDLYAGSSIRFYCTTERDGTTLTCKIYSDSSRTTLLDTLTITCHAVACRYVYPISNVPADNNRVLDGHTYDLDLQEGGEETHTPSDTAKASDSLDFKASMPLSDTAKAHDSVTFSMIIGIETPTENVNIYR